MGQNISMMDHTFPVRLFGLPSSEEGKNDQKMKNIGGLMPRVAVVVFVLKENSLLLEDSGSHSFGFPGSHLKSGESFEECAVRGVKEETGLDIEKTEFLKVTNQPFLNETKPSHYVTIFMRAVLTNPQHEPQNLVSRGECRWGFYQWDHLPKPLFDHLEKMAKTGINPAPV